MPDRYIAPVLRAPSPRRLLDVGLPLAAAALCALGCGKNIQVATPENGFVVEGIISNLDGSHSIDLVGCLPVAPPVGNGQSNKSVGPDITVGTTTSQPSGILTLGKSYRFNPGKPRGHRVELTGVTMVDDKTNPPVKKDQVMDGYALADAVNAPELDIHLESAPRTYAGAKCVRSAVKVETVRTLKPDGTYSKAVPAGSEAAFNDIGIYGPALVHYNPVAHSITVLKKAP